MSTAEGTWFPRLRYVTDHRTVLCELILDAVAMGVKIPGDMPIDTDQHVAMAIVTVSRLLHYARS